MPAKDYKKKEPKKIKVTKPKGRQLKKYTIKANNVEIMSQPAIIVIGLDSLENKVQLNIQGRIVFEEMLDMFNTAQYELLTTFFKAVSKGDPLAEIDEKKLKREIYDKAVLGFSLMIDKFLPEAKDDKYAGFTNAAVLEAQNLLKNPPKGGEK